MECEEGSAGPSGSPTAGAGALAPAGVGDRISGSGALGGTLVYQLDTCVHRVY